MAEGLLVILLQELFLLSANSQAGKGNMTLNWRTSVFWALKQIQLANGLT